LVIRFLVHQNLSEERNEMPIKKRWSEFTWDNLEEVPAEPGVYELGNRDGEITYTGSSKNLEERLKTHKRTGDKGRPAYFRYETSGLFESHKEIEARHAERYKEKHGELPPKQQRAPRRGPLWW